MTEADFTHTNRYQTLEVEEDKMQTDDETETVFDPTTAAPDSTIADILRDKNRKKREEYPDLPTKKPPSQHALNPTQTGRSNSKPKGGVARGVNVKGRNEDNINKPKADPKPPRMIMDQDPKDTSRLLRETLGISDFTIKRNRNDTAILKLNSFEDFKKANDTLVQTETLFYTFTPKSEKVKSFVLRGPNNSYEELEVRALLEEKNIENLTIMKVRRVVNSKSIRENYKIPLFVVQISPDSESSSLLKIKHLDHIMINWESLRKRLYTQCRRCQRLNHVSANCHMPFRCVKCGGSHEPGKCQIPANSDRASLFCVLCSQHGHPSSYSKCPTIVKHLEYIKSQKDAATEQKQMRLNRAYRQVSGDLNFANMVQSQSNQTHPQTQSQPRTRPNQTQPQPQNNNDNTELNNAIKDLQSTMLAMFGSLDNKLTQLTKKVDEN